MNNFFENPGLSHIGKEILRSLDFKSQASCRLVCKSWNNHIEDFASKISFKDLYQLLRKFINARPMSGIHIEEWNKYFMVIIRNEETKSIPFIKSYLKHVFSRESQIKYEYDQTPMAEFVNYGNIKMVKFNIALVNVFRDHKGFYRNRNDRFVIQYEHSARQRAISLAIQCGNLEMVKEMEISDKKLFAVQEADKEEQLEVLLFSGRKILNPGPVQVLERVIQAIQKCPSQSDTADKLKLCVETIHEMVSSIICTVWKI